MNTQSGNDEFVPEDPRIVTVSIRIEDVDAQGEHLVDLIKYGIDEGNYFITSDVRMTYDELDKLVALE